MTRPAILLLLILVASCAPPPAPLRAAASAGASLPACRSDPGALAVDRGIGGTGIASDGQHTAMRSFGDTDFDITAAGRHPPPCR